MGNYKDQDEQGHRAQPWRGGPHEKAAQQEKERHAVMSIHADGGQKGCCESLVRHGPGIQPNENTPEGKTSSTVRANRGGLWESWQEGNAKVPGTM